MIDGVPILSLTPGVLLGVLVLAIITGRLVPRRTHEDALHDRDQWRAAHMVSEQARQASSDQVHELLEHARTTDAFIRSLPHPRDAP